MSLDWHRLWGSIVAAVYFNLVISGPVLVQGNLGAVIYRAWPALEENWERRRRVEGRHPLQPSVARVLGALLIAAGMTLVFYATIQVFIDLLLGQERAYDTWDRVRSFLIFLMPGYMVWPAIDLKLRG